MSIHSECNNLIYFLEAYYNHLEQLVNGYLRLFTAYTKLETGEQAHLVRSNLWKIVRVRDVIKEILDSLKDNITTGHDILDTGTGIGTSIPGSDILCCLRLSKLRDVVYEIMSDIQGSNILRAFYGQALIVLRDVYRLLLDTTNKYCIDLS